MKYTWGMPGASAQYDAARQQLCSEEMDLRDHIERVAESRRALPPGPVVRDYEFFDGAKRLKLSELFEEGKPFLAMYHVMYWPEENEFCPMCSMWADSWNGVAPHVGQRANIVLASLAPPERLKSWAQRRGWDRIRLLADADDSFAEDTGAQHGKGKPISTALVFEKTPEGVRHRYTAHPEFDDGSWRGIDQLCATWPMFDLLPSGRDEWHPTNDTV
ncbi:MAG: DUF899 family protein [Candidatus Eremiobacteraeota bacterium]|nr:DUF899 family protein [Candidatus Eremiobacteraeota bacterium]